jgi:TetR/AcrR family transcriptional repressor of nem operon
MQANRSLPTDRLLVNQKVVDYVKNLADHEVSMPAPKTAPDTSAKIMDVAERLVQTRGFNGFSYADIARVLHITKASLHYHFPTKAKLGERLIQHYRASFLAALHKIDAKYHQAGPKLRAYVEIYVTVLERNRMCLCGMLAAEYATLPKPMKDELRNFFDANEAWLVEVLDHGRANKELSFAGSAVEHSRVLVAALEGAMLLARSHGEFFRLRAAANHLLADLGISADELVNA